MGDCLWLQTLKPGVQTIIADPPCQVEEGDAYGWRQDAISPAKTGGVGADTMKCDPGCTESTQAMPTTRFAQDLTSLKECF